MRNAFTRRISEIAKKNKDVIIITNDAPTPAFMDLAASSPDKFINAGIAEQNMTGMASGLALSGKTVFTYSIVPFVTMRCYEQVRNDVCYQNVNVKVVGIGGGICYASLGGTHTALEDVSLMRSIPNMTVVSPADPIEALKVADAVMAYKGPVYIRLGRAGEPNLYKKDYKFQLGKAVTMRKGIDVSIIGYGPILERALSTADELKNEGIEIEVINMHTLKPVDENGIIKSIKKTKAVITIEEHSIVGGIGSIVADILARNQINVPFYPIALKDEWIKIYGKQTDLWDMLGYSVVDIKRTVKKLLKSKNAKNEHLI